MTKKATKSKKKRLPTSQCYECGSEKLYYKKDLRYKSKLPYCADHLPDTKLPWPLCPECNEELGTVEWKGSVESSEIFCERCDFRTFALDLLDYYMIWTVASPLKEL